MENVMKRNRAHHLVQSQPAGETLRYAYSLSGGARRGPGIRMSRSTSYSGGLDSSIGGSHGYLSLASNAGSFTVGNEKATMQHLNDRLASYLDTVRSLEEAKGKLEVQISEFMLKRGPSVEQDYSKYNATITDLRSKIFDKIKENAGLSIAVDNARLATDDFHVKLDYETGMRKAVEADILSIRKMLDDTNVIRFHLESNIESLKEELITMTKDHRADMAELRAQITQSEVQVDVDAPKGQDLAKIMEEMRAKYERIALKNEEELKAWHESQMMVVQVQVTENTTALKDANTLLSDTRRRYQAMEIELQSVLNLKASLEANLRDVEGRYNMEIERYNEILLRLQDELAQIRSDTRHQSSEYEILLNIKMKLEAEIAEYRRLLDGEPYHQVEEAKKTVQTQVVTVTQTLVDGKVVSESKDVKASEKVVSA